MKSTLLRLLLTAVTLELFSCAASPPSVQPVSTKTADALAKKPPNVLFIVLDDLRPELGCYDKPYIHSPNIDALAKTGIVFNRAYCQQAVCSPSRSSVLTGMRPDTTKVWDLTTSFRVALPNVITLGQQFQKSGYLVQGYGKIYHHGLNDAATWSTPWIDPKAPVYALPENAEFAEAPADDDIYPTTQSTHPAPKKPKAKKNAAADESDSSHAPNSRGAVYESADVPDNFYEDGKIADLAVAALASASKKDQPFFIAVGFRKPHLPWVAPKKYWDLYNPAEIELAPNPFPAQDAPAYAVKQKDGEMLSYKGVPADGKIPPELAHKLKQGYFASISYSDAQVGKVLAQLDALHLRDNTIIILWGDHGWKLGEHGSWGKHTNVENDVNAPLILAAPSMKNPNSHTNALVEFVDIYPTLCTLANIPLPPQLEGTSLTPLIDNPTRPWKSAAFSQYPRTLKGGLMGYTMRTDRYRLTVWCNHLDHTKIDAIELYDHQKDSQENINIAKNKDQAAVLATLMSQYNQGWQAAKPPAE